MGATGPAPDMTGEIPPQKPFAFALPPQTVLRAAITQHGRAPEEACVAALLAQASRPTEMIARSRALAISLIETLRAKATRGPVEGLVREYDLSSQEGVALMCLAEALLRIPDTATRDALIRDKIGRGDWRSHAGHSPSFFVNAATWGLIVTGKLVGSVDEAGLGAALSRLIARSGEPLVRKGVDIAMRMMGEQFVTGQTIAEALARSRAMERKGFQYSYDMLGEAATTAADAALYFQAYEAAIHAIGADSAGRGVYAGPGISVKLSALHPRYARSQRDRVMAELLPRLRALALSAKHHDIGLNIDAEEADRLELSLDLLEALCLDPALDGWNGIGFVVQAYQKRAPFVLDWIIDLAKRSGHRLMVRLVKGAYWDSEIKRAQVDGLEDFPVFTRKVHTDLSYLACARKLLDARDVIFPQFATHNAHSVAAIHVMAGESFKTGDWEFQCLHGMGEPLYEAVVGASHLDRPARIYAPVGTHETLLAYLVRRLLENGANSSFVNRIQDRSIRPEDLAVDPAEIVAGSLPIGAPHPRINRPRDLFMPGRMNSAGLDLTNEDRLTALSQSLQGGFHHAWHASPPDAGGQPPREVRNPACHHDRVGIVEEATPAQVDRAIQRAAAGAALWQATSPAARATCLLRAVELLEERRPALLDLIVREAGKSLSNAIAEVREAVDFLRYYAQEANRTLLTGNHQPLGCVVCISPWNFPLAIFMGQVAAALAAGNAVLAKPAEETPLIAAQAVALLLEAGVPETALQLLPGAGTVGAQLVADPRVHGVLFTGSTEVARLIQRQLAGRTNPDGSPVPLIAETGGQNALIADSSALAEQVVADVLLSAFDSAGQRCSALRILCLQEDGADRILTMLKGALAELVVGNPWHLATDIGPVITVEARDGIEAHIRRMASDGCKVHRLPLPAASAEGSFVAPTIIEIDDLSSLTREVFGPVLHVLRYRQGQIENLIDAINATGYGLTFGLHTRLDETIARAKARVRAGNIYINRNIVGAVVGVQPFGGEGLSGTGPKAGGPLYLRRLMAQPPALNTDSAQQMVTGPVAAWATWLAENGREDHAADATVPDAGEQVLLGPVGERNLYSTHARGTVLCLADEITALLRQIGAALVTGNRALVPPGALAGLPALPAPLDTWVQEAVEPLGAAMDVVLFAGSTDRLLAVLQAVAARNGAIIPVHVAGNDGRYPLEWLLRERAVSINTTAAGGNAHLMMIG